MKKLLYSTLSLAVIASMFFVGCKGSDSDDGGSGGGAAKGPNIEFQTNTGTYSGYTFSDEMQPVSNGSDVTIIKIGMKVNSAVNLRDMKMTSKFNNQAEVLIDDTTFSANTKTATKDFFFTIPADPGTYTLTAYATDKDATTKSAKIVITAQGKLADGGTGRIYSLKASAGFSAYDLLNGEAITASSSAGNEAQRDIVDMSINDALSKSWKSQNGTEFVISGTDGKLNGKVFSQFKFPSDVLAAWNAGSPKATNITGVDVNKLIIAKSTNGGGAPKYYLIAITDVVDDPGSENDYYDFQIME